MFPTVADCDVSTHSIANFIFAEACSHLRSFFGSPWAVFSLAYRKTLPNLSRYFIGHSGATMAFAFWRMAMVNHVAMIVGGSSWIGVMRMHAQRIITAMKQMLAFWNRTLGDLPRYSMCLKLVTIFFDAPIVAILASSCSSCPKPASSKRRIVGVDRAIFVDFVPKSLLDWYRNESSFSICSMHKRSIY